MEWINVKDRLPDTDIEVLVSNSKGWMRNIKALYLANYKVFLLYDPNYREPLLLDVTHWISLPPLLLD